MSIDIECKLYYNYTILYYENTIVLYCIFILYSTFTVQYS